MQVIANPTTQTSTQLSCISQVDVDNVGSVAEEYGVNSMPTFLFIKDGKEVQRFSGASVDKLKQTVKALQY